MNRAQRRAAKKATPKKKVPAYRKLTKEERIDALMKNGITVKDLKNNYDLGYTEGFGIASDVVLKTCYAAICLALNELLGFGQKRCLDVLMSVDSSIMNTLTSIEIIDDVFEKIGIELDFNEPLHRINERTVSHDRP